MAHSKHRIMLNIHRSTSWNGRHVGVFTTDYAHPLSLAELTYAADGYKRDGFIRLGYCEGHPSFKSKNALPKWVCEWLLTEFGLEQWKTTD
jgi:hypothetical protein